MITSHTCKDDGRDDGRELAAEREAEDAAHRARQAQLGKLPHKLRAAQVLI